MAIGQKITVDLFTSDSITLHGSVEWAESIIE